VGRELSKVVRLGIAKMGCLGSVPLLEFLFDERAERTDLDVRVVGSGAKLGPEQCVEVTKTLLNLKPDFIIVAGPAQQTTGPKEARKLLADSGIPTLIISDGPMVRIKGELEKAGFGYIIVEADPMIGARREFLDPVEMAIFNSDVIKLLACTGVFNVIVDAVDRIIESLKRGEKPSLPHIVVDRNLALKAAEYSNPYARAKALAAFDLAKQVTSLHVEACFKLTDWKEYTLLVAAGHEGVRLASKLSEEAREIEKASDSVLRRPHHRDGVRSRKRALIEKPKKD